MGNESDLLRTGVAVVIVMERVAIGMVTVHVMEMVAMEMDIGTQKAVTLTAIDMGKIGMEEEEEEVEVVEEEVVAVVVAADMGKAEI